MPSLAPVQRLSMTVNLVIFLGMLSTIVHLLGWLGVLASYRLASLAAALLLCGCGYGIRYGSLVCLYAATGLLAGLSLQYGVQASTTLEVSSVVRCGLSAWLGWRLCQTIPLMPHLQQEGAFPLPMSRYGALVLRRFRKQ